MTSWGDFDLGHVHLMLVMLLLPLAGFVVQIFFGNRLPRQGDWLPTAAIGGSMLIAIALFAQTLMLFSWNWLRSSATEYSRDTLDAAGIAGNWVFTILFDNLTAVMLVVVGVVSFVVHVFSLGYMKGEVRYGRFFAVPRGEPALRSLGSM